MQLNGIEYIEVPFAPHAQNGRVERVHLVTVLRRQQIGPTLSS